MVKFQRVRHLKSGEANQPMRFFGFSLSVSFVRAGYTCRVVQHGTLESGHWIRNFERHTFKIVNENKSCGRDASTNPGIAYHKYVMLLLRNGLAVCFPRNKLRTVILMRIC